MEIGQMPLAENFQFSQSSLQDFVDCRRRFQLRYIEELAWPAVETDPVLEHERYLQKGLAFHRLVHQHLLGVPGEALSSMLHDDELRHWWENFLQYIGDLSNIADFGNLADAARYPEISLSAPIGEFRLVAKYDLILLTPGGRAIIFDWKTSRKRPPRRWLKERLQSRIYPYLLLRAAGRLNRAFPLDPQGVEMVYWFAGYPDQPQRFIYDQVKFDEDERYLIELVESIQGLDDEQFPLTADESRCAFCVYRSLCNRGIKAGSLDEFENADETPDDGLEILLDFEQIGEIEF
jgi:CRISPR/Cas system-associated exonuclease Cas4 (RecB family)